MPKAQQKIMKTNVPKPSDLGIPALSPDDVQELIHDLTCPEVFQEPPVKVAVAVKKTLPDKKKNPLTTQLKKLSPMVRLPSSYLPSKITSPTFQKKENDSKAVLNAVGFPVSLTGRSILKVPFKIPKKIGGNPSSWTRHSPSFSSPSSSTSTSLSGFSSPLDESNTKLESIVKLKTIDIFQRINSEKEQTSSKLVSPVRWSTEESNRSKKLKLNLSLDNLTIDKIKIIRSPSADKKHEIVTIRKKLDKLERSPMIKVKSPCDLFAGKEWSRDPNESNDLKSFKDESEETVKQPAAAEVKIAQPASGSIQKSDLKCSKLAQKEMKRLHENIVQDKSPLPSRRSCTMKRNSSIYCDSPVSTDGSDEHEKPLVKRTKPESEPVEAPQKVSSIATEESSSATKKQTRRKSLFIPAPEPTKTLLEKSPTSQAPAAKKQKKSPLIPAAKLPESDEKASPARTTRKSVQATLEKAAENLRRDPKTQVLNDIIKNLDIKPCAISLPAVTLDELMQKPVKLKQVARKSTNQRFEVLSKIRKRKLQFGNKKKRKLQQRTLRSTKTPKQDDEDDSNADPVSSDNDSKYSDDNASAHGSEQKAAKIITPFIYKNICNLAFTHCREGAIYKCLVQGCRFQVLLKHMFVRHLETRHMDVKWNGYCNLCLKTVVPTKEPISLMNELFHMVESHLALEKVVVKELPEYTIPPEHDTDPSEKSSTSDIDLELMNLGIDSILNNLLPDKSDVDFGATDDKKTAAKNIPQRQNAIIQPTSTIISSQSSPSTSTTPQTKVISKNIVGRVISLSKIPGFNNGITLRIPTKPMALHPIGVQNQIKIGKIESPEIKSVPIATVQNQKLSSSSSSSESIVKYVIKKPETAVGLSVKPMIDGSSSEKPVARPTQQVFQPLTAPIQFNASENIIVTNEAAAPLHTPHPMFYDEVLCQWLERRTRKNATSKNVLLTPIALAATFKCLGTDCCFYTNDSNVFHDHLAIHEKNSVDDKKNYRSCAYCMFESDGQPNNLIAHVTKEHIHDKFQCSYCFYRSCADFNVLIHQNTFHQMKPRLIMHIEKELTRNCKEEMEVIMKKRTEFVPSIICVCKLVQFFDY